MAEPATISIFTYDERPYLSCIRSILRDGPRHPEWSLWFQAKDALITRSRSTLATRYLDQGAGDVLVMIDQDISWSEGDLEHLIDSCRSTRGIVGGVYAFRDFGKGFSVRFEAGDQAVIGGNDEVRKASYVSTGFLAIHRTVLERLAETMPRTIHGFHPFFATGELVPHPAGIGMEMLSEDWAFNRQCRLTDVPIHADLYPRLEHTGLYAFRQVDGVLSLPPPQAVTLTTISPTDLVPVGKRGHKVRLLSNDKIISPEVHRTGNWEAPVVDVLLEVAEATDEKLLLWDVGAHVGITTVQAADAYDKVIAFEPIPETFELLQQNVVDIPNVTPVRAALVRSADELGRRMFWDYDNPGASHLLPTQFPGGLPIDTMTIAQALENYGMPDVIKMDVEGEESKLLTADPRMLEVPVLVLEYCDGQIRRQTGEPGRSLIDLLVANGYDIRIAAKREIDVVETPEALPNGMAYTNIVAIKRPPADLRSTAIGAAVAAASGGGLPA